MKHYALLLALAFCCKAASAQLPVVDTTYNIRYNNPYTYPKVNINLLLGFADGMLINQPLGGGIEADFLTKGFSLMANYCHAYPGYDQSKDKHTASSSISTNKLIYFNSYEAMAAFHFYDALQDGTVTLFPGGPGNNDAVKPVFVPIKFRRINAVRGGWFSYNTALKGNADHPFNNSDNESFKELYFTNLYTGSVFLGLMTRRVDKVGLHDYSGNRRRRKVNSFYADVMYGVDIRLDPLQIPATSQAAARTVDLNATPLTRVGWRIGWQNQTNLKSLVRLEAGQRPGLKGRTLFGNLTLGITLFGKGKRDDLEKLDFKKDSK
jgi:hypothetical protein